MDSLFYLKKADMKNVVLMAVAMLVAVACGQSYEEQKRLSRSERQRLAKENEAALKIAVMPTLDCLPLYVARQYHLFDSLGADVRLKLYNAQMDCDTALVNKRVEGAVTDMVRATRMETLGTPLVYITTTNAYWQLITNRIARIKELKQLNDKMIAMTRYSVTDMLADHAVDSARLISEMVFRIQVNDVDVRLRMLQNNEMDAVLLTEPQATVARMQKNPVLMDSRKVGMKMGVIAARQEARNDTARQKQWNVLLKAYNMACDSINKHGLKHYSQLISQYCKVNAAVVNALPADLKFAHATPPRKEDKERAAEWLAKKVDSDEIK